MDSKIDSIDPPDHVNSADEIKVIEPTFDHCKDAEDKLKRYISQGAIPKSFRCNMIDLVRSNNSVVKICSAPHIEDLEPDPIVDSIPSSINAEENDDYTEEGL